MDPVIILIVGIIALGGLYWYKKTYKKNKRGVSSEPDEDAMSPAEQAEGLYIKLVYAKKEANGKTKQPPTRFWPEPFGSVEEIQNWWDSREDLWEGVEKVELA